MRHLLAMQFAVLVLVSGVGVGCKSPQPEPVYGEVPPPSTGAAVSLPDGTEAPLSAEEGFPETASAQDAQDPGEPTELIVTPERALVGQVVSYNAVGEFAVLNFPVGQMPAIGRTLSVYRQGLKVGEVRISGPQRDDHIVADVTTGDCARGDAVRDR